jgi:creatinine amidohydrolase
VSDDTGIGNPSAATPEKGAKYFDSVCTKIAAYLEELAALDLSKRYE